MRQNMGKKPLIYPQPVLIIGTYNDDGTVDAMNAAWGGVGDDSQVFLCLSKEHRTVQNILKRKAFTVQIADEEHVVQSEYVGNDEPEKFAKSGLHAVKSEFVDAPVLDDYPIHSIIGKELFKVKPEGFFPVLTSIKFAFFYTNAIDKRIQQTRICI